MFVKVLIYLKSNLKLIYVVDAGILDKSLLS